MDQINVSGGIPKKMRKGYVLCHNDVEHDADTAPDTNGFRAWWAKEQPGNFTSCKCGWSGLPHFALPPPFTGGKKSVFTKLREIDKEEAKKKPKPKHALVLESYEITRLLARVTIPN